MNKLCQTHRVRLSPHKTSLTQLFQRPLLAHFLIIALFFNVLYKNKHARYVEPEVCQTILPTFLGYSETNCFYTFFYFLSYICSSSRNLSTAGHKPPLNASIALCPVHFVSSLAVCVVNRRPILLGAPYTSKGILYGPKLGNPFGSI